MLPAREPPQRSSGRLALRQLPEPPSVQALARKQASRMALTEPAHASLVTEPAKGLAGPLVPSLRARRQIERRVSVPALLQPEWTSRWQAQGG